MSKVEKSKFVCTNLVNDGSEVGLLTLGKVYEITKEFSEKKSNYDLTRISFIGDDGTERLLMSMNGFTPLDEWRQQQLNKVLDGSK